MVYFKRFSLVLSVAVLSFAPAALADDAATEPSALREALAAILDLLTPTDDLIEEHYIVPGVGLPPAGDHVGPQVVYVG